MLCDWCQHPKNGAHGFSLSRARRGSLLLYFCDRCRPIVGWYVSNNNGYRWLSFIGERLRAIGGYL